MFLDFPSSSALVYSLQLRCNAGRATELFDKFGPSPQNIFGIIWGPLDEQDVEAKVNFAASRAVANPVALFNSLQAKDTTFAFDALSHVCFVVPDVEKCSRRQVNVPTGYLRQKLLLALQESQAVSRQQFFAQMQLHSCSRTFAGEVFESCVHVRFQSGGAPVACKRVGSDDSEDKMQPTNRTIAGTLDALGEGWEKPPFYWRPSSNNFPGIDAILHDGAAIWAVQVTIASHHKKADKGLEKVLDVLGHKALELMRLVIV